MPDTNTLPSTGLPPHVEESIRSLARLHGEHHRKATPLQRAVNHMTALLGWPGFVNALTVLVVGWIGLNLLAPALGHHAVDPPPFAWLAGAVSLVGLYVVLLILTTQRHADRLAEQREQLTLELVILSERKTAKLIALLEEARRDNPLLRNRVDREADGMAEIADPSSVLGAIRETHDAAEKVGEP